MGEKFSFRAKVLNLGGGFGIRYTKEDKPLAPSQYVDTIIDEVQIQAEKYAMDIPEIWIEPGRSLVGEAGITLYTVGSRKEVPNVRKYLAVDGE